MRRRHFTATITGDFGFGIVLGQWDPPLWGYLIAAALFGVAYAFTRAMWKGFRGR